MEKTNGAGSVLNMAAQAGLGSLANAGRMSQPSGVGSFSETLMKSTHVKQSEPAVFNASSAKTNEKPVKVTDSSGITSANDNKSLKTQDEFKTGQNKVTEDSDEIKDLAKEISEITEQIIDKIKESFNVTDDEIKEAMEVLGLILTDLTNASDLRSLVMELTGTADSIELLTNTELYDSLKEITDFADALLTGVSEKFNMTKDELLTAIEGDDFKKAFAEEMNSLIGSAPDGEGAVLTDDTAGAVEALGESSKSENDSYSAKPVKVEVNVSDEVRTQNPVVTNASDNAGAGNGSRNDFTKNNHNNAEAVPMETQVTQTVNTVGDIVETVTSYTTYADTQNVMRQVTDFVRVNITGESTQMEMQLHPASLGTVNMQINSSNGQITAHLTVQNELVKSILEAQMVRLQESFTEQGSKVNAIEITVANYNLDRNTDNNNGQPEKRGRNSSRRGINLSEIESFDELDADEKLEAEVMEMNGSSVNYTA